jgi:anti-sigma B factor antagonist
MKNLNISERHSGSVVILDLKGKIISGEDTTNFHRALRLLVEKGERKILLNFAGVTGIDSSGLGELVGAHVSVGRIKGEIKLLNLAKNVIQLIECTKFSTIFNIYDNETKAVRSFRKRRAKSASASQTAKL